MKRRLLLALSLVMSAACAQADEVHVFAPSVVKASAAALNARFQADTGHRVVMHYGGTGLLLKQLGAGERADVVILPSDAVAALAQRGEVDARIEAAIGTVGIGVAVRADAPQPDISTPEALRQTLLQAGHIAAIAPGNSTSGSHFAQVIERLGIAKELAPKLLLVTQGYSAEKVARGEADIAVQQTTEILPVAGVRLAGPLPGDLQKTTTYVAAVHGRSGNAAAAQAFVRMLVAPPAQAAFAQQGFTAAAQR